MTKHPTSPTTASQIQKEFPQLVTEVRGNAQQGFQNISPLENIAKDSLVYVLKDRSIADVKKSAATVILVSPKLKDFLQDLPAHQTWILSPNPELLMAFVKNKFLQNTPYRPEGTGHHPTCIIDESANVSPTATIGPHVVIGPRVQIGAQAFVGANTVIEADASIGKHSTIHPLVYIGHSCHVGERCEIKSNSTIGAEGYGYAHDEKGNHYRIPHSGRVILHDDVHVGSNTAIDRGSIGDTVIGQGTKIDNQVHLAHNTIVGKNCLITAQFGAAGSCTIGNNFISGGKVALGGHLKITDNVQIAGMSGVTGNVDEPGQYGGYPLQPLKDFLKTKAAMLHLPEIRKQFSQNKKS